MSVLPRGEPCQGVECRSRSTGATSRTSWLVVGLLVLGCLVPSTAWAQEWYELYANGERALRNGQAQRAAELLQRAIQQRPQPGVAIPTYGTNFEPRYFPYLRLAEAYLRTEAYDDALRALETSARFRAEPAAERVALEARIRAGMDTKRPPRPAAGPSPESVAALEFKGATALHVSPSSVEYD